VPIGHDDTGTEDGDKIWADPTREDEFKAFSMMASCPITSLKLHFWLKALPDSAFETFSELLQTNAWVDAGTYSPNECQS
jgi:hypothetical protein